MWTLTPSQPLQMWLGQTQFITRIVLCMSRKRRPRVVMSSEQRQGSPTEGVVSCAHCGGTSHLAKDRIKVRQDIFSQLRGEIDLDRFFPDNQYTDPIKLEEKPYYINHDFALFKASSHPAALPGSAFSHSATPSTSPFPSLPLLYKCGNRPSPGLCPHTLASGLSHRISFSTRSYGMRSTYTFNSEAKKWQSVPAT